MGSGRLADAIECFRQAKAIQPDLATAPLFIGHCLLQKHGAYFSTKNTLEYCNKLDLWSTHIDYDFISELNSVGYDLQSAGKFSEALDCFDTIIRFRPDNWQAHLGAGKCLLSQGEYREGGSHIKMLMEVNEELRNIPIWRGEDLHDKVLLVVAEQGIGDIVQFIRYVPFVAARAARVVLKLRPSMRRLIGNMRNVEMADDTYYYHYACGLFALPHIVGFHPLALPGKVPYLSAEPDLIAQWRDRLPRDGMRIGIAWDCGKSHPGRAIPLAAYAPIAALPGVKLVSLQVGLGLDQLNRMPKGMSVIDLAAELGAGPDEFVATAAVMQNLDLIVTIDTSVAHVAGALGLPVWLLLQSVPDWRWLQERQDSPWYPTMRIFRQSLAGDWDEVIARVTSEIASLPRKSQAVQLGAPIGNQA